MIVWDRGRWEPIDDPDQYEKTGKLHFVLHGYKLRGEWILVRTKRGPKDWLLYKKKRRVGARGDSGFGEASVLLGPHRRAARRGQGRRQVKSSQSSPSCEAPRA